MGYSQISDIRKIALPKYWNFLATKLPKMSSRKDINTRSCHPSGLATKLVSRALSHIRTKFVMRLTLIKSPIGKEHLLQGLGPIELILQPVFNFIFAMTIPYT